MRKMTGVLLAGTAWAMVLGLTPLQAPGNAIGAGPALAADRGVVVAQPAPRGRKKSYRRTTRGNFVVQGAAPGWTWGIPVTGGLAAQDAAGPVPQVDGLSGPGW